MSARADLCGGGATSNGRPYRDLKDDSQMAMSRPFGSEAGQNRDGNSAAITPERTTGSRARVPESID